ncbi:MAG: L,D-transpeptidase [Verrucomicrobiales bacterium]|nr:L,D-transpeptidase [Verrucomicrobiales bacterium]
MRIENRLPIVLTLIGTAFFAVGCSTPEQMSRQQTNPERAAVKTTVNLAGQQTGAHVDREIYTQLTQGIAAQKQAGHPDYAPQRAYVVDPSEQKMMVLSLSSWQPLLVIDVGTGKNGLGFGSAQTPTGFFTMGGVRIAKDASAYIQTGDSKTGVSGVYAEMLYPPSHESRSLRGRVPNNVIIHGFNPSASGMLRERHRKKMIGRIPCTTGCPVPGMKDLPRLAPYLKDSAGEFDPTARPNSNLRSLIRRKQVIEYSSKGQLGDPILILDRPFRN